MATKTAKQNETKTEYAESIAARMKFVSRRNTRKAILLLAVLIIFLSIFMDGIISLVFEAIGCLMAVAAVFAGSSNV